MSHCSLIQPKGAALTLLGRPILRMTTTAMDTITRPTMNSIGFPSSPGAFPAHDDRCIWTVACLCACAQAPGSLAGYGCGMQPTSLNAVLATVCVSAALIAGLTGNFDSLSDWAVLAGIAVLPPAVLIWRWNAPGQPMCVSIQEPRR